MHATDPRHGSQAGFSQHARDNEPPCHPCHRADIIASRRRRKRRDQGLLYRRPIGHELHTHLAELRATGATYQNIADWAGIANGHAWRICNSTPDALINAATWLALANMQPTQPITNVGLTRRIRALYAMGYSGRVQAAAMGITPTWLGAIRDAEQLGSPTKAVRRNIVAVYDRLHMHHAPTDTSGQRKGATRARNHAAANGWASPLAWENIDDPAETPSRAVGGSRAWDDYDESRVERILGGDWALAPGSRKRERIAVIERWTGSLAALEEHTGWKIERDYRIRDGKAVA